MPELQIDELIRPQNIRKLVQKTVDTYPLDWKVVHEALQNAKDAVQKAARPGAIHIVLDVTTQSVRVTDNGCGFPYNIDLLGIGGTDKDEETDWRINGSQGVGIKAVIFSTVRFRLESVHGGKRWEAWIDRASDYLQGLPVTLKITEPVETPNPTGTTVEYRFEGSPVLDFLNSVVNQHLTSVHEHLARDDLARVKLIIEFYFRAYTYAGDVNRLLDGQGVVPMTINVVILATGEVPSALDPVLRD
jgi:hypothetical protein